MTDFIDSPDVRNVPRWRGVNYNIFSQSTWIAGDPSRGENYVQTDTRTIDYFLSKGVSHLRMMFTWEWLQPSLLADLSEIDPFLTYWDDFVAAVDYATGRGIEVTIGPYGYSPDFWGSGSGETTPSWKGVGSSNGVSYTNRIGGASVTNADFGDLWTKLATFYLANPLVSFDLVNEPHDMPTVGWFATAQSAINAIRAAGSRAWILVPGNGYANYDVAATYSDAARPRRSNAYGWANANGVGSPLNDPLDRLVAECHIYLDDAGGSTLSISGYQGGTPANAARIGSPSWLGGPVRWDTGSMWARSGSTPAPLGRRRPGTRSRASAMPMAMSSRVTTGGEHLRSAGGMTPRPLTSPLRRPPWERWRSAETRST